MKNTSIVKRYYAMNLNDGRILLATRELLTNPDYRVISEALARNIERVQTDWRKIAFELRQRDNMSQTELLKRSEQEKVKNVRSSQITRENVEQFETKLSEGEVGEVFDGGASEVPPPAKDGGEAAPAEPAAPAEAPAKKSRGGRGKSKPAPVEEPAEEAAPAEPAEAEELDL